MDLGKVCFAEKLASKFVYVGKRQDNREERNICKPIQKIFRAGNHETD